MKKNIYHNFEELSSLGNKDVAITIGNFDGVHRGHKYLLTNFRRYCLERNYTPIVLTFNPHPIQVIKCIDRYLINNTDETISEVFKTQIEDIFLFPFTKEVQKMSGNEFINHLIKRVPGLKAFYLGHDFSLGANREFDFNKLKEKCKKQIECVQEQEYFYDNDKPSSTQIRNLIQKNGNVSKASKLLGRPYHLSGEIIKGNQVGKTLGFPTANLKLKKHLIYPKNGVYFARVCVGEKSYAGLVNIGLRPTVTEDIDPTVEVFILNFNNDLYGHQIRIEFIHHIRNEKKFSNKSELIEQIEKDKRSILNKKFEIKFALIGKNIKHTKSPDVYCGLLNGYPLHYSILDYDDKSLIPSLKKLLLEHEHISVTSPYKEFCFSIADEVDGSIDHIIKSTNCLKLKEDKVLVTNTDYMACKLLLGKYQNQYSFENFCLLGNGAMAQIFKEIFLNKDIEFTQFTRQNMDDIESFLSRHKNTLVINSCSREFIFPDIKSQSYVFWDLNYSMPEHVQLFYNKKVMYIDGMDLLREQAKYALSFWNLNSL